MNVEPCSVCGGTDVNLVDGFYYCVECGTQDTNVRETVVEDQVLADGTFTIKRHHKITIAAEETLELSGEWHKWHAFNFILAGVADELIAAGAKPTFKMKLLWLWTKYIKMFQKKKELGLDGESEDQSDSESSDDEINNSRTSKTNKRPKYRSHKATTDLSVVKKGVLLALVYAALNLDHSEIQLSDLIRYIEEGRFCLDNYTKYLPKEIKPRLIPQFERFKRSHGLTPDLMPIDTLTVFKCLNILPILPDLRLLIDRYIKELCLPNDFKNLVQSLMNLVPCDSFLDLDRSIIKSLLRMPSYECTVMSYILVAFKMCFGLDGDYEEKISDTVEKINDENCYLKSYKLGDFSEPTSRLFSFREWCSFIQLRKIILCKYCLYVAERYSMEIDDYVYMEQCNDRKKAKEPLLSDEITMNILDKIPQTNTVEVISKSEFKPTLTPLSTYTDLVLQYFKDPDLRLLFSEDFTKYSLKYACEKLKLCNEEDTSNILLGVDETSKIINEQIYGLLEGTKQDTTMVYVRNCDNKNWLKTNQPTVEHIKIVNKSNSDRDSDHSYDSNLENTPNNVNDTEIEISSKDEESSVHDKDEAKIERKCYVIEEEDIDKNIFDDDFENLVFVDESNVKEENEIKEEPVENENYEDNNHYQVEELPENQDNKSDISDINSKLVFNPDTFDRAKTIKELVLAACQKYKIKIPKEYSTKEPTKRKSKLINDMSGESGAKRPRLEEEKPKRKIAKRGEVLMQVHGLLADYYSNLQNDVMFKISEHVKSVVDEASRALGNNEADETDRNNVNISEQDINIAPNDTTNIEDGANATIDDQNKSDNENIEIDSNLEQSSVQVVENDEFEDNAKGDPQFDEKEYDIKQLYVKVGDEEEDSLEAMFDDPTLNAILDKKIDEISKGEPSAAPDLEEEQSEGNESESDDDIPLIVLKEEIASMKSASREKLHPLIKNQEHITEFKYWTRFYAAETVRKLHNICQPFNDELRKNFSASFDFVIRECAGIANCTPYQLYKCMVCLEKRLLSYNNG